MKIKSAAGPMPTPAIKVIEYCRRCRQASARRARKPRKSVGPLRLQKTTLRVAARSPLPLDKPIKAV